MPSPRPSDPPGGTARRAPAPLSLRWRADASGQRVLAVTPEGPRVLGLPARRWQQEPALLLAQLHPEDRERTLTTLRAVAADGRERTCMHRLLSLEGGQAWFLTRIQRAPDSPDAELEGLTVSLPGPPVSEAQQREVRAQLRPLLAQLSAFLYATDAQLRFTATAGAALVELGLSGPLEGLRLHDLLQADGEAHPDVAAHLRALGGESVGYDTEWFGRPFAVQVQPAFDAHGRIVGTLGLAQEVGARRQREEALRASEERLRSVIEASPDPIFLKDGEGRWLEANSAALRLFELEGVDYRGRTDAALAESTAFFREALLTCEVTDQRTWQERCLWHGEETVPRPDGSVRTYDVYKVPLFHPDGRRKSFVVLGRDVTEARRAQQERDRLLAQEQEARAAAEEAVRVRDEFLSIASHELRTPLTSLQMHTQRLLGLARAGTLGHLPQGALVRALENVERQNRRLTSLVQGLLDVSVLDAGRLRLEPEPVDLVVVVQEVAEQFAEALARARSPLVLQASGPVVGRWDRARLEQVVSNLLSNAIKYGPERPIAVAVRGEGGEAVLTVRDEGIGIPPGRLPHVFERFERAVSSRHYGGLGLGLFIVRQLVEQHGGRVQVESAPGQGALFTVRLPLAGPA